MNNQLQLIKALLSNTMFVKYGEHIKDIVKDNKEFTLLYNYLDNLHNKYNRDIKYEEFALYVLINCMEKDKETLSQLLGDIGSVNGDSGVFEDILQDVLRKQKAYELAIAALEVSEGRKDFDDLVVLGGSLSEQAELVEDVEDEFITTDLEELAARRKDIPGLHWRLQCLNDMFGPIRQGNFGMIVARSNVGKTSFLASEISHFATQTDRPILWLNMEQEGHEVTQRIIQSALDLTLVELYADIKRNKERFYELCGGRIKVYDDAGTHKRKVEQLVEQLRPGLIVFDTLDKVKGFTDDREDLRLGAIYQWGRELAKKYCPVFTVCQASATAEGKKYLTAEDVSSSKTSKIAECDFVLGIGKSFDATAEYTRYFHSIKNKLPDANPDMRHGRCEVSINQETGRYSDIT